MNPVMLVLLVHAGHLPLLRVVFNELHCLVVYAICSCRIDICFPLSAVIVFAGLLELKRLSQQEFGNVRWLLLLLSLHHFAFLVLVPFKYCGEFRRQSSLLFKPPSQMWLHLHRCRRLTRGKSAIQLIFFFLAAEQRARKCIASRCHNGKLDSLVL